MTEPEVEQLNCPKCNSTVTLRAPDQSEVVACVKCKSILDVTQENVMLLKEFDFAVSNQPKIPLGSRGKIYDDFFEVIGFLVRKIQIDFEIYRWSEYLLFNPEKGFRWLTEYEGHWNKVHVVENFVARDSKFIQFRNLSFERFQSSYPEVEYLAGEFYWKIKTGDKSALTDYICPPFILSVEKGKYEITYSLGEYVEPEEIWECFSLEGKPPSRKGVFANQTSPYIPWTFARRISFAILAIVAVGVYFIYYSLARNENVLSQSFTFTSDEVEPSRITDVFELKGHTSNVQIKTWAGVNNSWVYFDMALINDQTGEAMNFGREISYYYGYDSDGSWSEGRENDTVFLSAVSPGFYYLRIEPQKNIDQRYPVSNLNYSVNIIRDDQRLSYLFSGKKLLRNRIGHWRRL